MPELAAIYFAGLAAGLALTLLFIHLRVRRQNSRPFRILQDNLQKAGFVWSENRDSIEPWGRTALALDQAAAHRSAAITGVLLSLLSWGGVFFLLIVMISYWYLARSRYEISLLSSPLASEPHLSADEVRSWLMKLELIPANRETEGLPAT